MMTMTKNSKEFMAAFDGAVDQFCTSGTKFDAVKLAKQFRLSNREIIAVQSNLKVEDLELLAIGSDAQNVEGYSNLTKAQQRELLCIYHSVLEIPTVATREKKQKIQTTTKAVKAPKAVKVEVAPTPDENYDAVFAVAGKYRCLRTFVGNVVISGSKITADAIQEYRYPREIDAATVQAFTQEQFLDFMQTCKPIPDGSVTLIGKCIDSVHKF